MIPYYPLGVYKDQEVRMSDLNILLAGFGGQGVLFTGKVKNMRA